MSSKYSLVTITAYRDRSAPLEFTAPSGSQMGEEMSVNGDYVFEDHKDEIAAIVTRELARHPQSDYVSIVTLWATTWTTYSSLEGDEYDVEHELIGVVDVNHLGKLAKMVMEVSE